MYDLEAGCYSNEAEINCKTVMSMDYSTG